MAIARRWAMMSSLDRHLAGRTLILVSNREPYEHLAPVQGADAPKVRRPAGGLVSALDPTMRRTHGTWVAWGSGTADRESADAEGRLMVPPEEPAYTLRRVWLDDADVEGYYLGFANTALWPLCHMLVQHYQYRAEHWDRYLAVNRRFADAAAEEARRAPGQPVVWVQDYHFALAPAMLRERLAAEGPRGGSAFIHQFWHIPFPPPDILHLLPYAVYEAVVRGLLGNDLVEFHTDRYAGNFLDCVAAFVPEASVEREERRVYLDGRTVHVGAFPISIDVERYESLARSPEGTARAHELRRRYVDRHCQLGVSVDRIDYTKGIPERLRALDRLWAEAPELRECLTFLFVATPSRSELTSYRALETEVVELVKEINARYGTPDWTPIVLVKENVDADMLASIYRAGDICLVSSLQDGMNLVAKEFIACNVDEHGVLVLSRFTGAAEEFDGVVLINPFNVDGFVNGLRAAFDMPPEERQRRMHAMREQLHSATIFDWLESILARVDELAPPAPTAHLALIRANGVRGDTEVRAAVPAGPADLPSRAPERADPPEPPGPRPDDRVAGVA
jgi:alpha,alpha-trehalose-phosphate synthase [UDP-forming]